MAAVIQQSEAHANSHPVDLVEELIQANEWAFERTSEDEIVAEVAGGSCGYRLYVAWQDTLDALYLSCQFDMKVPGAKRPQMHELLVLANEKMLVGHFDLCSEEMVPMFRHTLLLRGTSGIRIEQLEDLVEIGLSECERFFPAFQFVLWGGAKPKDALEAALLETVGEA